MAPGRGKALELGEVLEQLRRGGGEIHPGSEQSFQQVEFSKTRRDRRHPRRGRGFLEVDKQGVVLALRRR